MISVITLTYKRKELLEEAIESFVRQGCSECEMIVINDCEDIEYELDHPSVRIVNIKDRFPSVLDKLMYGFSIAKYDHMYRLDDDDLLSEFSLEKSIEAIKENPGYDIYRSKGHYYFLNNKYQNEGGNVNNGNIYTKKYIEGIKDWPVKSFGEDYWITFSNNARIHEYDYSSMIYRWGMGTYHLSGMTNKTQKEMYEWVDRDMKEKGFHVLTPKFNKEYYEKISDEGKHK